MFQWIKDNESSKDEYLQASAQKTFTRILLDYVLSRCSGDIYILQFSQSCQQSPYSPNELAEAGGLRDFPKFRLTIQLLVTTLSKHNHCDTQQNSDSFFLVGAHERLCRGFCKNSLPAWRLILDVQVSTARHFLMADISDIKDFRHVTKAERIFAESTREKESQVQEERWTGLGLQG